MLIAGPYIGSEMLECEPRGESRRYLLLVAAIITTVVISAGVIAIVTGYLCGLVDAGHLQAAIFHSEAQLAFHEFQRVAAEYLIPPALQNRQ